jgi:threonine dehydrogenase-like Zn-dependent dehydrogenase
MNTVEKFKTLSYSLPKKSLAWRIYGKGMENFGDEKKPTQLSIPDPADDEILVRSDAVGLCFSDTKIIKFGNDHPRIKGRNLKEEPVIPGHEVALTVVKAGKNRQMDYKPGERYIIQADVRYRGSSPSYGYVLPGGLSQYGILGKEILDGDEGSYLIPLFNKKLGYSELALVEPWGCVVAAYRIKHRNGVKDGGALLCVGKGDDGREWDFSGLFTKSVPKTVVLLRIGEKTEKKIRDVPTSGKPTIFSERGGEIKPLVQKHTGGRGFDDIILLGDQPDGTVAEAGDSMCAQGILNYMVSSDTAQVVSIDAGKIHYDVIGFFGSAGTNVSSPYTEHTDYNIKGESALMIGAGGPMGQMHVQLAMEKKNPPRIIVATDIDDDRIAELREKFNPLALEKKIHFHVLNPNAYDDREEYKDEILQLNNRREYDYVVCLAAIPAVIEDSARYLGNGAVLNIFAGVSKGTIVQLNIKDVALRSVRYIGSSGSSIDDMEYTLRKLEKSELDTNSSVAGISGMNDVWKGIDAVRTGSFTGKIVVYPHIQNMDLISLKELKERYPKIAAELSPTGKWTKGAEEALIQEMIDID